VRKSHHHGKGIQALAFQMQKVRSFLHRSCVPPKSHIQGSSEVVNVVAWSKFGRQTWERSSDGKSFEMGRSNRACKQ
jgi:hypothetical protein